MVFGEVEKKQPVKKESNDCEIEIRNTNQGRKIRFKGKCNKEQISMLQKENGVDVD